MSGLRAALKEWSAVIRAVAAGDQIVLVRKGGIAEKKFDLPAQRFLLFPTQFHQPENQFRPEFASHVSPEGGEGEVGRVKIDVWAEVVRAHRVESLDRLMRLAPHVIFTADTIRDRFAFRPRQAMHVLALRAWRLPAPVTVPVLEEYAGCRSWIELHEPVDTAGSELAMDPQELGRRLDDLDHAVSF